MVNLSWLAEVVFFGSGFIAWLVNKAWIEANVPHPVWVAICAIASLVVAVALLFFNGYPYLNRRGPAAE